MLIVGSPLNERAPVVKLCVVFVDILPPRLIVRVAVPRAIVPIVAVAAPAADGLLACSVTLLSPMKKFPVKVALVAAVGSRKSTVEFPPSSHVPVPNPPAVAVRKIPPAAEVSELLPLKVLAPFSNMMPVLATLTANPVVPVDGLTIFGVNVNVPVPFAVSARMRFPAPEATMLPVLLNVSVPLDAASLVIPPPPGPNVNKRSVVPRVAPS